MFCLAKIVIVATTLTISCHAQSYTLTPLSAKACPVTGKNAIEFSPSLGSNGLSWTAKISTTLDKSCTLNHTVERLQGEFWTHYTSIQGTVCEVLNNQPTIWNRIKENMEPVLEEECNVPPNSYKLIDLKVSKEEVDNVNIVKEEGKFRSTATMSCQGEEIGCILIEFECEED